MRPQGRTSRRRTVGLLLGAAALLLYGPADAASARRPRSAIRPRPRLELAPRQAASLHLHGPEASLQLLATRVEPSGLRLDRTPMVRYDARPGGVVHVSAAGQVAPLRDGTARITAREGGTISRPVLVQVSDSAGRRPPSFTNEIVPLFTRAGCNGGSCHGRTGGQAGFELSLFGFEPQEDHARFAADRRRLNPSAPGESLLLRKATAQVPHRGGRRWESNSPEYRAVLRWIARMGDPVPPATEAVRLEVTPAEQTFAGGGTQQLAVLAYFADGSVRDVTDRAVFESNLPDDVEVSREGRVRVGARPGVGAVMARYQSLVGVFRAVTRRGPEPLPAALPGEGLEALLARQWRKLGLAPSPPCDDGTFLRRATLDLVGRLPTLEETRAFLADRQPDRDARLVDRLLASEEYADHFAGKWSALLRNRRAAPNDDPAPTAAFHRWIRDSLHADRPFDRFAGEIVTAAGDVNTVPQTVWYREVRDSAAQAEDVAQLFLGQRIACARCHHHPQERWSQRDYYGLAAFFSRVRVEDPPAPPRKQGQPAPVRPPLRVEHQPGPATLRHPRTNAEVPPVLLGGAGPVLSAAQDPRAVLAAWFSEPANPYFARTLVNRYWKHFFGRGLVDPEDDMRSTNPAPNPELLEYLAGRFRAGGFSLKRLVRLLCTSRAYRLSSEPTARNGGDRQSFARFYPRRLPAEVLLDAINQVTGQATHFPGAPPGTRATQLPDNQTGSYFLSLFGRPEGTSACECERSTEGSLAQALHMLNSPEIQEKLGGPTARRLAADPRPPGERLRELYLLALCRPPSAAEQALLEPRLHAPDPAAARSGFEDVIWTLLNSRSFLFTR